MKLVWLTSAFLVAKRFFFFSLLSFAVKTNQRLDVRRMSNPYLYLATLDILLSFRSNGMLIIALAVQLCILESLFVDKKKNVVFIHLKAIKLYLICRGTSKFKFFYPSLSPTLKIVITMRYERVSRAYDVFETC